jgi:hypothetical protein
LTATAETIRLLVAAAIVDQNFRLKLLEDPLGAAAAGYLDYRFPLSNAQQSLLRQTTGAETLAEFAQRLLQATAKGNGSRTSSHIQSSKEGAS